MREADAVLRWGREAQDNEYQHLRVIDEKLREDGVGAAAPALAADARPHGRLVGARVARAVGARPCAARFLLNAEVEDHAEHYYAELVELHPEWEEPPVTTRGRARLRRVRLLGRRLPPHRPRRARPPNASFAFAGMPEQIVEYEGMPPTPGVESPAA